MPSLRNKISRFRFFSAVLLTAMPFILSALVVTLLPPENAINVIYFTASALAFGLIGSGILVFKNARRRAKRPDTRYSRVAGFVFSTSAIAVVIGLVLWGTGFPTWFWASLSNAPVLVKLEEISGISKETQASKNTLYRVIEPIPYLPQSNIACFEVEILGPGFEDTNVTFVGDGSRFNEFVSEVKFVQANQGALFRNLGNGAASSFKALWNGLEKLATTNPVETFDAIKKSTGHVWDYVVQAAQGQKDMPDDLKQTLAATYIGYLTEIASEAGINFANPVTEEARRAVEAVGKERLIGSTTTEIAMFVVPFVITGKTAKLINGTGKIALIEERAFASANLVQKAFRSSEALADFIPESRFQKVGYKGILSGKGNPAIMTQTARQLSEAADLLQRQQAASRFILSNLTDPLKLATLKGARPANGRLHKIMFYLNKGERNGKAPIRLLRESLPPGTLSEFYYDQSITQANLLETYKRAKQLGIFDSAENLQRMSRGLAPTIQRGPNVGQIVEVDHIIPRVVAPELVNNMANLRYLEQSVHAKRPRPPILDADATTKIRKMKSAGWSQSATPAQTELQP